ncbi:Beta-lactamase domain-containing protein [Mycena venus]|uniref:Beta-lactamase domain-containing protein n=1 Tax=Mycena venus TaxID=2733690 RepID=A0A8H7CAV1_9AGAR|nr:Beta-lactamase domain-containing protein [Mycena venus]
MLAILTYLLLTAALGGCTSQVPLNNLRKDAGKVVNEELSSYIQDVLQTNNFTGLSLGIVLPNGEVEFAAWGNRTEEGHPVTSEDLLSHVTGLPGHDASYSPYDSPQDIVLRMKHLRAAYELRERYEYNNQMYITGAYVISKYSGSSYRDFVEERILKPLGMTSSTLHPNRAIESGKFTQSWTPSRRRIPSFMPEHTADLTAGAGGVMSNVEDMVKWIKMLLNSGVDGRTNDTILPATTFDLATSAISIASNKGSNLSSILGYGLGWVRQSYRGHELVWHNGGAPGVATIVDLYPYDGFGIVLLANTAGPSVTRTIERAVVDCILGLPTIGRQVEQEMKPRSQSQVPLTPAQFDILAGFTGTYSNPGYGNFTLCSPLFPTSAECLAIIQDFRTVDSAAGRPTDSLELYSAWPRFWGSHLRISPVSGYEYRVKLTNLYVNGYGADSTPFEDVSNGDIEAAKFVVKDGAVVGLGFFVALKDSWRVKKGGPVRDVADVWFDKL